MNDLLNELDTLISLITVDHIADKIDGGCLWDWCGAWRQEADEIIQEIRRLTDECIEMGVQAREV